MHSFIITNNPLVRDLCKSFRVEYADASPVNILIKTRDYIHKNHKLLTHPVAGGVKPNETPYKTVFLTDTGELDVDSLNLIENSIAVYKKFPERTVPEHILNDLQELDYTLITAAIESKNISN